MAKIRDARPQNSSGAYFRLVKNSKLAEILTKAQSTVITNGTELEKIISEQSQLVTNLDDFMNKVKSNKITQGSYLCTKKVVKNSRYKMDKHEPDFMIFTISNDNICNLIELKDGDNFDTKKSTAEFENLKQFTEYLAPQISFIVKFFICCFNQDDKDKIIEGFKHRFNKEQILTGREFCELLKINYDEILKLRERDAADNFHYVIDELSNIIEMRACIQQQNREHIEKSGFYDTEG